MKLRDLPAFLATVPLDLLRLEILGVMVESYLEDGTSNIVLNLDGADDAAASIGELLFVHLRDERKRKVALELQKNQPKKEQP